MAAVESNSEVRSDRNASANCDFGWVSTLMFRCAVDRFAASSADDRRARGIMARDGNSVMLSISAMVRSPVSRLSSRNASTMPPSRLKTTVVMMIVDCGCSLGRPVSAPDQRGRSPTTPALPEPRGTQPLQQTFVEGSIRFEAPLQKCVLHQVVAQLIGICL